MHRGHMLLVGVGGSGKKSITRLAAFAAQCDVFEISLTRGYSLTNFREDLKILFNKTGVDDKRTAFVLSAAQVQQLIIYEQSLAVTSNHNFRLLTKVSWN